VRPTCPHVHPVQNMPLVAVLIGGDFLSIDLRHHRWNLLPLRSFLVLGKGPRRHRPEQPDSQGHYAEHLPHGYLLAIADIRWILWHIRSPVVQILHTNGEPNSLCGLTLKRIATLVGGCGFVK